MFLYTRTLLLLLLAVLVGVTTATESQPIPTTWNPGKFDHRTGGWIGGDSQVNILWAQKLGDTTYGTPVVIGGKVFCATTNHAGHSEEHPSDVDLGVLLALDTTDGSILWQYSAAKLPQDTHDWPEQGICSTPVFRRQIGKGKIVDGEDGEDGEDGDTIWFVNNRCEVICLAADQPTKIATPIWSFDMMSQLGVVPHHATSSSPVLVGDLLFTGTSNGVDPSEKFVVNPEAPSFIALEQRTGQLRWQDNAPGNRILDGQWASPTVIPPNTVVFPAGDGWLYTVQVSQTGEITPLWKFDCNPKSSVWKSNMAGDRNFLVATPVFADGLLYIATGRDPESGDGPAVLWCIDPSKMAEYTKPSEDKMAVMVSNVKSESTDTSSKYRDVSATVLDGGGVERPNPHSIAVWEYHGRNPSSKKFADTFHRTIAAVAIYQGLVLVGDHSGMVHCLDSKTGTLHWTHDVMATVWGAAFGENDRFFLGTEAGDVVIFAAKPVMEILETIPMGAAIYTKPVCADGKLFIATNGMLFCIGMTDE